MMGRRGETRLSAQLEAVAGVFQGAANLRDMVLVPRLHDDM